MKKLWVTFLTVLFLGSNLLADTIVDPHAKAELTTEERMDILLSLPPEEKIKIADDLIRSSFRLQEEVLPELQRQLDNMKDGKRQAVEEQKPRLWTMAILATVISMNQTGRLIAGLNVVKTSRVAARVQRWSASHTLPFNITYEGAVNLAVATYAGAIMYYYWSDIYSAYDGVVDIIESQREAAGFLGALGRAQQAIH